MKTTTIQLLVKTKHGEDPFGAPIESEEYVDVEGVLVGQPTSDDVANALSMYDKKIAYILGIPKGDTHDWIDAEVIIWGNRFRTVGYPITGEESNIPMMWGKNVQVEHYG